MKTYIKINLMLMEMMKLGIEKQSLKLTDLIEIDFLQKFQDTFAEITGMASLIYDRTEPITKPSNFTDFCSKYLRSNEFGQKRCSECDLKWGRLAAEKKIPVIYDCHAGLTDFVVPIIVAGEHIASIYGGQILTKSPDEEEFRKYAEKLGINENDYINALRKIKIVPKETVNAAVNLLSIIANTISSTGLKNLQLKEINKRNQLYRTIVETVRSTLDIEETLSFICEKTAKIFNVQRTAITSFENPKNYEDFVIRKEYKISSEIKGFGQGQNTSITIIYWMLNLVKEAEVLAFDNIEESDTPDYFKNTYTEMGVKSIIGVPIKKGEDIWGTLVLSEYNNYRHWTEEEKNLLKTIANQVYIAVNQAELFDKEKKSAERERILRKTINILRSTLDPEEIKKSFIKITCKYFNADRCLFDDYNKETNEFLPFNIEVFESTEIKSILSCSVEDEFPEFAAKLKKGKNIIIKDLEKTLSRKKLPNYLSLKTLKNNDVKSDYGLLVKYQNQIMGVLILHFLKEKRVLTHDELEFLKVLKDQVGIALYQAELFDKEKKSAERERILRTIIESVRRSLNMTEAKRKILYEVGRAFKADRCYFRYYDEKKEVFLPPDVEYLASPEIRSLLNVEPNQESLKCFSDEIKKYTKGFYPIVIDEDFAKNTPIENYFNFAGIKADYVVPIISRRDKATWLVLHYLKEDPKFNEDYKKLLETIAYQIDITFEQIRLYNAMQKTTANQYAILNNMPFMAWLKNSQGNLLAANEEYAKMCNLPLKGIIGKTDFELFAKEYADTYAIEDQIVLKTKQTISSMDIVMGPDGERWHETFKSPVLDRNGDTIGTVGISQDITERKNLEMAIIENKNQLKAILDNIPHWAWLKDKENKYILVNKVYSKDKNLQPESFIGKTDFDLFPTNLAQDYTNDDNRIMKTGEKITIEEETVINGEKRFLETYKQAFFDSHGEIIGTVGIGKDITERKKTELELLLRQEKIIKANEREAFLRKFFEAMRKTLDINVIKNTIVTEIGKSLGADICFIMLYNSEDEHFYVDEYSEYRASEEEKSYIGASDKDSKFKFFINIDKKVQDINFANVEDFITKHKLWGSPEEAFLMDYGIKSAYNIDIYYADVLLGYICINFTKRYIELNESDMETLRIISIQAGTAFHQAELYKITQIQAEREKISRNIIEILRSTLDKDIIKRLFVKNIGKFFNADRVLFSDYNYKSRQYLPVNKNSEYLSSPDVKSFIGYDWSNQEASEYIQPLMDKREFNIYNWDEYIKSNAKGQNFINLFVNANVKSSYNLPVMYQQKIMGFFSIEFTQKVHKFSDEDIKRIRNICTQAGIALYHADLYKEAQKSARAHIEFVNQISNELKTPLNMIIEFSEKLSESEFEREEHTEDLNNIKINAKKLLYLLENIIYKATNGEDID